MKSKLVWCLFIILGFTILITDTPLNWKYFTNVIKELRTILRKNSKYTEDGDYQLVHKDKL